RGGGSGSRGDERCAGVPCCRGEPCAGVPAEERSGGTTSTGLNHDGNYRAKGGIHDSVVPISIQAGGGGIGALLRAGNAGLCLGGGVHRAGPTAGSAAISPGSGEAHAGTAQWPRREE